MICHFLGQSGHELALEHLGHRVQHALTDACQAAADLALPLIADARARVLGCEPNRDGGRNGARAAGQLQL